MNTLCHDFFWTTEILTFEPEFQDNDHLRIWQWIWKKSNTNFFDITDAAFNNVRLLAGLLKF